MAINKIDPSGAAQSVSNIKKTAQFQAAKQTQKAYKPDAVDIAEQSTNVDKVAYAKAMDIIAKTPDVRTDKISELQKNVSSYTKPSSEILQTVAEKLLKDFLG